MLRICCFSVWQKGTNDKKLSLFPVIFEVLLLKISIVCQFEIAFLTLSELLSLIQYEENFTVYT